MPSMNLKKFWKRKKSVDISEYDPTYKVIYLGNVLTGWAKGDGCVEKPLSTLWRNYCQSTRPDISMKVTICGAGLRAVTREHGLTEYWAHRVTFCTAHPAYPRVFCWVYRHEGRRLKQELRCHAVLCPKQGKAETMASQLQERLLLALREFRREKEIRQNARLSVINAVYDTSSVPLRKFYLVTGSSNYRPPLERSKSAPKLGAIEEILDEEEEYEDGEDNGERRGRDKSSSTPVATSSHFEELLKRLRHPAHLVTPNGIPPRHVALVYQHVDESPVDIHFPQREVVTFSTPNLMYYSPHSPEEDDFEDTYKDDPHLNRSQEDLRLLESFKDKMSISNQEDPLNFSNERKSTIGLSNGDETLIGLSNVRKTLIGLSNERESMIGLSNARETLISMSIEEDQSLNFSNVRESLIDLTNGDESLIGLSNGVESLTSDQPESIGSHSCSSSSCDGSGDPSCDGDEIILMGGNSENGVSGKGKVLEEEDNISEESGYSEDKECMAIKV